MNEDERLKLPPYPEFWQNYGADGEQIPVTKAKVDAAFAEMYRPRLSDRYDMATGRKRSRWSARLRYMASGIVWHLRRAVKA